MGKLATKEDFMNERQPSRSAGICIALMLAALAVAAFNSAPAECAASAATPTVSVLATGLQGAFGSTVGPDGALYVTESAAGRISRINPRTGQITTFASGLPKTIPAVGVGGATDVAFVGNTMYVLVTLVSPDVGGSSVDGIYRLDGPNHFTVVANIGDFNERNPPTIPFSFFVKSGVLFAMKPYRKGFLVTDGHLNRMLQVTQDGQISILIAFDDIVPTGLTVQNATIYMAEAGPVPHLPQNGKVVAFKPGSEETTEVASGASLLDTLMAPRGFIGQFAGAFVKRDLGWVGLRRGQFASRTTLPSESIFTLGACARRHAAPLRHTPLAISN
jgi:hypothetical protein